jgi:hypothetical protein
MSTKAVLTTFTAVACVATAGLYGVEVPAIAQPVPQLPLTPSNDCDWIVFSTGSDLDQGNGTVVHIEWGRTGGTASYSSQGYDWRGNLSGPVIVKGTNELDFSVSFGLVRQPSPDTPPPAATNNYSGSIDPGGTASGTWNNNSGASGTWTMGNTFKCIGKAPAQNSGTATGGGGTPPPAEQAPPPEPEKPVTDAISATFSSTATTFTANVTNSSAKPANCHYEATAPLIPTTVRDFKVGKNSSTQIQINGLATGTTYHVVIDCNDASRTQQEPLGHVEQDLTF